MITRDDLSKLSRCDLHYLVHDLKDIEATEICSYDVEEILNWLLREGYLWDLPFHRLDDVVEMRRRLADICTLIDEDHYVQANKLIEELHWEIKKDYRLDCLYDPELTRLSSLIHFMEGE